MSWHNFGVVANCDDALKMVGFLLENCLKCASSDFGYDI